MFSNRRSATAADEFRDNLQTLQNDLSRLARQATTLFGEAGDKALGDLTNRVHWLGRSFDDAVSVAGTRGRKAMVDASNGLAGNLQDAVMRRPLATLAIAAGLGVLFGSMTSRR